MAERGVILVHTTILRWVQHYVPEFEKCWNQYARPVGGSWRCDETYIKVKSRWTYLYRAVDKVGGTVDFYLSERRDVNAAKHFFRKAIKSVGSPRVITLDAYAASHRAVRELKSEGRLPRRSNGSRVRQPRSAASSLCRKFRSSSLRPIHWVGAQLQCRNFGMPCWPPDPKCWKPEVASSRSKLLHQSPLDNLLTTEF